MSAQGPTLVSGNVGSGNEIVIGPGLPAPNGAQILIAGPREARNTNLASDQRIAYHTSRQVYNRDVQNRKLKIWSSTKNAKNANKGGSAMRTYVDFHLFLIMND